MFFRFTASLWRFQFCRLRNFLFRPRFRNSLRLLQIRFLLLLPFLLFLFLFLLLPLFFPLLLFLPLFFFLFLLRRRRLFLRPFFLFRFLLFFPFLPFLLTFLVLGLFFFRPLRSRCRFLFICLCLTFCRLLSSAFRAFICCLTAAE